MKEIKCAFCKGKGIDPFKILSPISICAICEGKGKVKVEEPYIKCAFCHGTGVYPHTKLSCNICKGKGVVTFREPGITCPECKGKGQKFSTSYPCLRCGGKGVIKKSPRSIGEEKISRVRAGASTKKAEKLHEVCALRVESPEGGVEKANLSF
jgi:DnaJ-class molecular chaperone